MRQYAQAEHEFDLDCSRELDHWDELDDGEQLDDDRGLVDERELLHDHERDDLVEHDRTDVDHHRHEHHRQPASGRTARRRDVLDWCGRQHQPAQHCGALGRGRGPDRRLA
jgi:hypothetical protein